MDRVVRLVGGMARLAALADALFLFLFFSAIRFNPLANHGNCCIISPGVLKFP
jgi:hypothetical protein